MSSEKLAEADSSYDRLHAEMIADLEAARLKWTRRHLLDLEAEYLRREG